MRLSSRPRAIALTFTLMAGAGCAPSIPRYHWSSDEDAIRELFRRANEVRTIEAACAIALRDENDQHVTLDGALVARQPDYLRIRAWKFEQALFDVTATPDGVWIDVPDHDTRLQHFELGDNISRAWAVFSGEFMKRNLTIDHKRSGSGEIIIVEAPPASSDAITSCVVERDTLTPTRYEVRAHDGTLLYTIRLESPRQIEGIIWPCRIVFGSGANSMSINLRDVELNGEINPNAFTPPPSAVRQP